MAAVQTNIQKAGTLLMNLDTKAASQLLQGLSPEMIQELAVEIAKLNASGPKNKDEGADIVRKFYGDLKKENTSKKFNLGNFLDNTIASLLGKEKTKEIEASVKGMPETKDIFAPLRSVDDDELVFVLKDEHPQTVAVILSELETKKVQKILVLFDKENGEGKDTKARDRNNRT